MSEPIEQFEQYPQHWNPVPELPSLDPPRVVEDRGRDGRVLGTYWALYKVRWAGRVFLVKALPLGWSVTNARGEGGAIKARRLAQIKALIERKYGRADEPMGSVGGMARPEADGGATRGPAPVEAGKLL